MDISSLLTTLFRKSHEVQLNYLTFLNDAVIFNCSLQNELDLLVEGKYFFFIFS